MKILMVCLGNICRSPIAHGIMESKIKKLNLNWTVDSAGTSGWHVGEQPDKRAIATCKAKGLNIVHQKSRKITKGDIEYYDVIFAMDANNYNDILRLCQSDEQKAKVKLMTDYLYPGRNTPIPDPYYDDRFEEVYTLIDLATDSFLKSMVVTSP